METIRIECPDDWNDYELIDTGNGEKLERFGDYRLIRPDPRILWNKRLPEEVWKSADASYNRLDTTTGAWDIKKTPPDPWHIRYNSLIFTLRPTEFKHLGVFPEQAVNWNWLMQTINGKPLKILNLFAYTGGATMAALSAGAHVTHVDAVKSTVDWAHENVVLSDMDNKPVRWIEDDAYKFVMREKKRGNTYDGVIMDPPRFGRGPKGEVWKLEHDLPKLMKEVAGILSPDPTLFLINAYTADISSIVLENLLNDTFQNRYGETTFGELGLKETTGKRMLPNGIFARWSKK